MGRHENPGQQFRGGAPMSVFGRWLGYSYHRRLLDGALIAVASELSGKVLDVGGTRSCRGRFSSDMCRGAASWVRFNLSASTAPDVLADGARLPVRDAEADSVICTEVLEYVDSPVEMLRELARILRPGGKIFLSVPFVHRVDNDVDRWRFSEPWLLWQAELSQLEPVGLYPLGGPLATCAQIMKTSLLYISWRPLRFILGLAAWPLLEILFVLDRCWPDWNATTGWSTGYLLVARKRSDGLK